MSAPVADLVGLVLRDGSLYGARPGRASKTLTVAGRRRVRIRLQADICRAILTPATGPPFYPDLWPVIVAEVARQRPT